MSKKISSVGPVEDATLDPFKKWEVYNEIYVLSEESRGTLSQAGTMRLHSGIEIKVERYSLEGIKNNPQLSDKIGKLLTIGAIGFGVLDEIGNLQTLKFHQDIAQLMNASQAIQITNATGDKQVLSVTANIESLSTEAIESLSKSILMAIAAAANNATEELKEDSEQLNKETKKGEEMPIARPFSKAVGAKISKKLGGFKDKEASHAAELMINQRLHQAEFHRQKRKKEKKEKQVERKEQIIKHEILKEGIKNETLKKEQKG